jgi:hypothetical protein
MVDQQAHRRFRVPKISNPRSPSREMPKSDTPNMTTTPESEQNQDPEPSPTPAKESGPGEHPVGVIGITAVIGYLTLFAAFLLYLLVALWPVPTPSGEQPPGEPPEHRADTANPASAKTSQETTAASAVSPAEKALPALSPKPKPKDNNMKSSSAGDKPEQMEPVYIFGWRWDIADEVRLLMLVICAGALGSLVHGLRSIYWYVGQRELVWSWIAKYLLLPFTGSVLAVVFYFVVRGGFFSPRAGFQETSPFGFAALAAMVGMFSEQAVLKLKEISETLLSKPAQGKNAEPQGDK